MSTIFPGDNLQGQDNPDKSGKEPSRPLTSIPRKDSVGGANKKSKVGADPISAEEGKSKFASAAKSAAGAAQGPSAKPKKKTAGGALKGAVKGAGSAAVKKTGIGGIASSVKDLKGTAQGIAGTLGAKATDIAGGASTSEAAKKAGSKKAAKKPDSKTKAAQEKETSKLKAAGKKASKNVNQGAGDKGGKDPNKAGVARRTGKAIKTLGKERCKICGFQNGLNKVGICKRCVKLKRTNPNDVSKSEKAQNKAVDLAAKAAAKTAGHVVNKATMGVVPPKVVEKLTEGFIGKTMATSLKFGKMQVRIFVGAGVLATLIVAMLFMSIFGGGSGPPNLQGGIEEGSFSENTADIPAGQLETYVSVAASESLPWSILAGVGSITTEHGYVSPYDDEERESAFPYVQPGIVGATGRGPMLLTSGGLSDGTISRPAPGGGSVLDPSSANIKFEKRPGRANPGGGLLPATAAAQDFIEQAFPNNPITSDWRVPDPPFNFHNRGEALDIGCKDACTKSDIERLHVIAAWFAQNPNVFGLKNIIWEQRSNSGSGWTVMEGQGSPTANHYDHIHLAFGNPGLTALGPAGGAWAGSSLTEVSANSGQSPYKDIAPDEDNSGESTVPPGGGTPETTEEQELPEGEDSQSFTGEVIVLAELMAESRDIVYDENKEEYEEQGYKMIDFVTSPFGDDVSIEFWQKVLQRLPIDFENVKIPTRSGGGGGGSGSNVILGDDVESVISQLLWSKRWIESSNQYNLVNPYGFKGAYQYGNTTWGGYGGYTEAHLAPPAIQDEKMALDYRNRLIAYENDVKKAVQHHLCPKYVDQDGVICELQENLSSVQVNPDMGTYWACAAVLLNALPGNEGKYSYTFTSAPPPGGVAAYEANCIGRIPTALQDPALPDEARNAAPAATATQISTSQTEAADPAPAPAAPNAVTTPVSTGPPEIMFSQAVIRQAKVYSGLESDESEDGNATLPGGIILDGNPSAAGFIWPTTGPVLSEFGMRWGSPHRGLDISPPRDTPVVSSKEGTVLAVVNSCGESSIKNFCGVPPFGGYGNVVYVQHEGGFYTLYAHLQQGSITVKEGDKIVRGQQVGGVGSSGNSTGPHLHFEVHTTYASGQINPREVLPGPG